MGIDAGPHKALLTVSGGVFLGNQIVIVKDGGRIGKINAVFVLILHRFVGVPDIFHGIIVH